VHGIIATNRHRARLDPQVSEGCPFCGISETVFHLFLDCIRLQLLFPIIDGWCQTLGEVYSPMYFIYGHKYKKSKKESHVLMNFLLGQVKMAIWMSRKEKLSGNESCDVESVKGLIRSRLKIEYTYYKLVNDLESFKFKWGVNQCICDIDYNGN